MAICFGKFLVLVVCSLLHHLAFSCLVEISFFKFYLKHLFKKIYVWLLRESCNHDVHFFCTQCLEFLLILVETVLAKKKKGLNDDAVYCLLFIDTSLFG